MSRTAYNQTRREFSFTGLTAASVPTVLVSVPGQQGRRGTFTVTAPGGTGQTLDVTVFRRPTTDAPMAPSPFDGFLGIQPGESRCMDVDLEGASAFEFVGTASGGGISGIAVYGALNS